MICKSNEGCMPSYYCDPSTHICHSCEGVCLRDYDNDEMCQTLCPEIWQYMMTTTKVVKPTLSHEPNAESSFRGSFLVPFIVTLVVGVLVITILTWCLLIAKNILQPCRCLELNKLNCRQARSFHCWKTCIRRVPAEKTNNTDILQAVNDEQDGFDTNRTSTRDECKSLCAGLVSQPTDGDPSNSSSFLLNTNEVPLKPFQSAINKACSSAVYNLCSDPISTGSHQLIYSYSRATNNGEVNLNQVMKAFKAVEERAHELPFVNGCMIDNDVLHVIIKENYSLREGHRQIMDVIPPSVECYFVNVTRASELV